MADKVLKGDASGRGQVEGFRVSIPARQHPYTEEEIATVVDVMRNCECQTQGPKLAQFQKDFAEFTGANHAFAVDCPSGCLTKMQYFFAIMTLHQMSFDFFQQINQQ